MTRNNSKREHKERFLRSENFRLLLTKPSKHMWNVIKITPHGSGEPDSGGLKCVQTAATVRKTAKGWRFVSRYAREAKHQKSTVTDKQTLPRHTKRFVSELGGLFSI